MGSLLDFKLRTKRKDIVLNEKRGEGFAEDHQNPLKISSDLIRRRFRQGAAYTNG